MVALLQRLGLRVEHIFRADRAVLGAEHKRDALVRAIPRDAFRMQIFAVRERGHGIELKRHVAWQPERFALPQHLDHPVEKRPRIARLRLLRARTCLIVEAHRSLDRRFYGERSADPNDASTQFRAIYHGDDFWLFIVGYRFEGDLGNKPSDFLSFPVLLSLVTEAA